MFCQKEKEHSVLMLPALILNLAGSQGSRVGKSARGVLINSHGSVTHRQQPRAGCSCFQPASPRVVLGRGPFTQQARGWGDEDKRMLSEEPETPAGDRA